MNDGKPAVMDTPTRHRYHEGMNRNNADAVPGVFWFVSRHLGAIEWAKRQSLAIDRWVTHLDPTEVANGDTVIGTLPVNLAAEICKRGVRYLHLSVSMPLALRGQELSAEELLTASAELRTFRVEETL